MERHEMTQIDMNRIEAEARKARAEAFRNAFVSLGHRMAGVVGRLAAKGVRHA